MPKMVKRILKLFHSECSGLHKAAVLLGLSSLASSVLALFRDRLLAGTFGAGKELDLYYAAFRVPDFVYVLSITVIAITVLIPMILERAENDGKEKTKEFLDGVLTVFVVIMFVFLGIAFFAMPWIAKIIAPGFSEAEQIKLVLLSRILLLSPFFMGLSNLFSSIVQSYKRFYIMALSPILYNLGIIIGIVFFCPVFGLKGLIFGVVLGAFAHFFIKIPTSASLGLLPKITKKVNFREVFSIIKLSLPRAFGLSLNQIVLIFITAAASSLAVGSLSVFNLSYNLESLPLAIIGVSYSIAAFPTLSKFFVSNNKEEFFRHIVIAARQIIFWLVPASVSLIVLRAQIVRVLFGYGNFDWTDTRLTAAALAVFSVAITAQALVTLFVRAFYAAGKTARPVMINVFANMVIISLLFVLPSFFRSNLWFKDFIEKALRVDGLGKETSILMLPLAFAIGMILDASLLMFFFRKTIGWTESVNRKIFKGFSKVLSSSVFMGVVMYFFLNILDNIFDIQTVVGITLQGVLAGIIGATVWFTVLYLSKNQELLEVLSSLRQKFWQEDTVVAEAEKLP